MEFQRKFAYLAICLAALTLSGCKTSPSSSEVSSDSENQEGTSVDFDKISMLNILTRNGVKPEAAESIVSSFQNSISRYDIAAKSKNNSPVALSLAGDDKPTARALICIKGSLQIVYAGWIKGTCIDGKDFSISREITIQGSGFGAGVTVGFAVILYLDNGYMWQKYEGWTLNGAYKAGITLGAFEEARDNLGEATFFALDLGFAAGGFFKDMWIENKADPKIRNEKGKPEAFRPASPF